MRGAVSGREEANEQMLVSTGHGAAAQAFSQDAKVTGRQSRASR